MTHDFLVARALILLNVARSSAAHDASVEGGVRLSFYSSICDIGWSEVGHYSTDRRVLSPRVTRSGGGGT